ncbi:MAG: glycosyltransferase family 2 protein [Saprospiraceae bacterium]|nr:glycosyltransferase family 2 protein [Saprospiraceae bacterium]
MNVTGFTFIRNAIKFDYPIVEAILSVLPLCDEFVVAVGNSEDDTLTLIKAIKSTKIRIIETTWDDSLRDGGRVLALETDKAFQAISGRADWCFYIQGDEVVHEKYHDAIRMAMHHHLTDDKVDGLLFKYLHFYGSYDYIATSSKWYKNEIRIVRNNKRIYSFRDAQGFRKEDDKMLRVKQVDAYIYHYGWVKPPVNMQLKQKSFQKLWHDDHWVEKNVAKSDVFDYSGIDILEHFKGTHPEVMKNRIQRLNWTFDHDISLNRVRIKERFKNLLMKYFGWDLNYRNYKKI